MLSEPKREIMEKIRKKIFIKGEYGNFIHKGQLLTKAKDK